MAEKEEDEEEKLGPSIRYLQRLGPEHLAQIFEFSRWVINENKDQGFQVRFHSPERLCSAYEEFRYSLPKKSSFRVAKWINSSKVSIPNCRFGIYVI